MARRSRGKALRGIDNRPGLKKIGQLDAQARRREQREQREAHWQGVQAMKKALQSTVVRAGKRSSILFAVMPEREQDRLALEAYNKRAAA